MTVNLTAEINTPDIAANVYRATTNVLAKNQEVLLKFSEDSDGNLMYDGERLVSVPPGGETGEALTKQSDADYDFGWKKGVTLEYTSGVLSIF